MSSTPFVRSMSAARDRAAVPALPADVRWMRYTANGLLVLAALLLGATALHLLGIDHTRLSYYHNGIERRLTDVHGHVIGELLA